MHSVKSRLRGGFILAAFVAVCAAPALAQENPFRDVPTNSWAYQAIQKLYADGLIEGYPGGYFKGQRPLTRYEAAVLTERVVKKLEEELAKPEEAAKVNAEDIAMVKKLVDEYGSDIKNLQKDVAGLKDQVAKNSATLDRAQFHLYYFMRAPGFYRDQVSAYDPLGNGLPASTVLNGSTGTGNPNVAAFAPGYAMATQASSGNLGANNLQSGDNAHGTGYQTIRMIWSGNLDARTSYSIRLEDRNYFSNQGQNSAATGAGIPPNGGSYFYNQYMRLNWAFLTYKDPSGFYAKVGRYVEEGGPIGLAFADYFQGAELGYSQHGLTAYAGYSFNYSNGAAENAAVGGPYQSMLGHIDYNVTPKFNLGANYDMSRGLPGETFWNASVNPYPVGAVATTGAGTVQLNNPATPGVCAPGFCGAWVKASYPIAVGSVDASYQFTPEFSVAAEALHRFGKDPSGNSWEQPNAFWGKVFLGKTGPVAGNNWAEGGFISSGQNSLGPDTEVAGTPDYQQFYFNNPNGYRIAYVGLHHWFSNNADVGVIVQGYGLNPNTNIPLGGGYYINHDTGTAVFLQTLISF